MMMLAYRTYRTYGTYRTYTPAPKQAACERLHSQQFLRLIVARRRAAILAGRHAGQGHELPPFERRPHRAEFLGHRAVKLLRVQGAVFAGRVLEQHIEDWPGRVAELAVAGHKRRRQRLVLLANRSVETARKLNPALQSFEQFVTKQKAAIKTAMGV